MKPTSLQQEILLITTSRVSQKQLSGVCSFDPAIDSSYSEKLGKVSWNGLLDKILKGAIKRPPPGKKLHLWQIKAGANFIHLELCTFPEVIEKELSINPYVFVPTSCTN